MHYSNAEIINHPMDVMPHKQTTATYEDDHVKLTLVSYPIQEIIVLQKVAGRIVSNVKSLKKHDVLINIPRQMNFINAGLLTFAKMAQQFNVRNYFRMTEKEKYIDYVVNTTKTAINKSRVFLFINHILINDGENQFVYEMNNTSNENYPVYSIYRGPFMTCNSCNIVSKYERVLNNSTMNDQEYIMLGYNYCYYAGKTYCANCRPNRKPDYIIWGGNKYTYKLKLECRHASFEILNCDEEKIYFNNNNSTYIYRIILKI